MINCSNKHWELGTDADGREYRKRRSDGYTEYKLDKAVANRVKELRLGLNGSKISSWRVISISVTGIECQMTGKDLCRLTQWTLGEEWDD